MEAKELGFCTLLGTSPWLQVDLVVCGRDGGGGGRLTFQALAARQLQYTGGASEQPEDGDCWERMSEGI